MKLSASWLSFLCASAFVYASEGCFQDLWKETLSAYELYGNEKYIIQEEITQSNHVLQAASLAKLAGAPSWVVVALLFHDIGQVIEADKVGCVEILHPNHAEIGARYLQRKGFSEKICDFVKLHALAKIVLCQKDPKYFASLSLASQISHEYQQQKYNQDPKCVAAFMKHPLLHHYLAARKCDDMAKMINISLEKGNLEGFDAYYELVKGVHSEQEETDSTKWIEIVDAWHHLMLESRKDFETMMMQIYEKHQMCTGSR